MGPWCSRLNIPLLQSGDEKYNVGSNPTGPTNNGIYQPNLISWRTVVGKLKTWVRVPLCRQKIKIEIMKTGPITEA